MKNLKHVGKIKNSGSKVLVVFRTLPGESNMALVVQTAPLSDQYHNAIIDLVDSDTGQDSWEFGEILFARPFPDGRPMLAALHQEGRLVKVATKDVEMTPTTTDSISLDELNKLIAEQRGLSLDELAVKEPGATEKPREAAKIQEVPATVSSSNDPLSDKDLARSYRSQADAMYKEAAKLRKQADDLDPPQKKTTKSKEEVGA
jgi:hypothetical protein